MKVRIITNLSLNIPTSLICFILYIFLFFSNFSNIPTKVSYLHINCTSNGLGKRPSIAVFNGNKICLQSIYECQQVFSAAIIGAIESRYGNNDEASLLNNPLSVYYGLKILRVLFNVFQLCCIFE